MVDVTVLSAPCSPSNLSSVTLVGSTGSDSGENNQQENAGENGHLLTPPSSTTTPKAIPDTSSSEGQFTYHTPTVITPAPYVPVSVPLPIPPPISTPIAVASTSKTAEVPLTTLQNALSKHAEATKDVIKSPLKIAHDRKFARRISDSKGKQEGMC